MLVVINIYLKIINKMSRINTYSEFINENYKGDEYGNWVIHYGLGGGFGGARNTEDFEGTYDEACDYAHELARTEYQRYEGLHGLLTWNDVAEENELDPDDEAVEEWVDILYNEEINRWADYYVERKDTDEDQEYHVGSFPML